MQILRKLEAAKKAIMSACNTCKGHGCRDCIKKVESINVWADAGIPVLYWDLNINTFNGDAHFKNTVKNILSDIDKLYNNGDILVFSGSHGTGKTWAGAEILKFAASNKYTIQYASMSEIVTILLSKDYDKYSFNHKLLYSDIIFIDEVDGRFMPSSENGMNIFGAMIENIVRTRIQNKLPILLATNNSQINDVFDGSFKKTFSSLFSLKNLINIPVGGTDLRK